ncbi:MAG: hypothetical protein AAF813_01560 [Pseudomonadota bacterium]
MSEVRFYDAHRPAVAAGTYKLKARYEITGGPSAPATPPDETLSFNVGGPITALSDADVVSVYPPPGSLGPHTHDFPHVVLSSATLPFARLGTHLAKTDPWMALILVTEADLGGPLTFDPPARQSAPERITLPSDLLRDIAPPATNLTLHTHVRERDGQPERAVVLCSRLPQADTRNHALLISVQDLYAQAPQIAPAGTRMQVTVLRRWSFSCIDDSESFAERKKVLESNTAALRIPDPSPQPSPDPAAAYRKGGWSLMPMARRDGSQSYGFYRGPFAGGRPGGGARPDPMAQVSADGLLEFHEGLGLFDTSYAAAWELGRLLALASTDTAQALAAMHRQHVRHLRGAAGLQASALPAAALPQAAPQTALPQRIYDFLGRLLAFDGVPFSYLVPDEALLPPESARAFAIDPHWMACLLAGALSPGRRPGDPVPDGLPKVEAMCGVLIRSNIVRDFPSLEVRGYASDPVPLPTVQGVPPRAAEPPLVAQVSALPHPPHPDAPPSQALVAPAPRRLSPTLMLVLFKAPVVQVTMHPHSEALHHGFVRGTAGAPMEVYPRKADGTQDTAHPVKVGALSTIWQTEARQVIDLRQLLTALSGSPGIKLSNSASDLARQTVQPTAIARFGVDLT